MYKVFSGEKCILIKQTEKGGNEKDKRVISFSTAEVLHREYKQFMHNSKPNDLVITGDEKIVWRVFRSLFLYIESAGGAVKNEKGELLMIYRNKHWDLPKGKIEKNESPEEASVREVEEECGLKKLKIEKHLANSYHIFFQDQKQQLKCTYWFEMTCNDLTIPTPQKEEGIEQVKWMSKDEVRKVQNKIFPSLQQIITVSSFLSL